MVQFKILHKDGQARLAQLTTPHGIIETPNFVPVGTQGSVKALSPRDLKEIGVQVVLANTYHLMLRPGADVVEKFDGLHKFMGWDGPIMTDSGGFQVFSLGVGLESGEGKVLKEVENDDFDKRGGVRLAKVNEEGVTFQSHIDGSKRFLGPKESIKIQHQLGADLIVAFDDHESIKMSKRDVLKSLELTEKWGLMSLETHKRTRAKLIHLEGGNTMPPLLYGVIHGALYEDLRVRSARFTDKHFDAISIGGIYGCKKDLYQIVEWVLNEVSDEKPRHLLGIGEVEDLFNGVERGIDLFDCVAPTRRARFGSLYISAYPFTLNIALSKYTSDKSPVDSKCNCYTCQNFSRAYLRHLYLAKEILFHTLATYHNIYFIEELMRQIRESIKNRSFDRIKKAWIK